MSKLNPPEAMRSEKIRGWLLKSLDVTDISRSGDDVAFLDADHSRFPESFEHTLTAFAARHVLMLPVGLKVQRSIPFAWVDLVQGGHKQANHIVPRNTAVVYRQDDATVRPPSNL